MMITIICLLSACLLLSILFIFKIYNQIDFYKKQADEAKKQTKKAKEDKDKLEQFNGDLMLIEPGDKVIFPDYGLVYEQKTDKEVHFKVTYELEVLEVSQHKVKVKAVDFTSTDSVAREPAKKAGIIEFMKDKWVDKKMVQLVIDNSMKRELKLRDLGIT